MLGGDRFSADDAVVVLGPGGGGLFLHEACGHGLEADGLVRGTSVYARTTGRRIASPSVTALDDPTLPGGFGSYAVDDEGRPSARTLLIDGGRQVGAVTDGATAGRREAPGTANGRCESFAHRPLCRLSNTYLAPGPDDAADIVRDVARGLYVARLSGGQVDIATGEFAFTSSEAYLIERGELTRPVRNATIVGTGPAALGAVDAVGDDLAFTQALCGKDGQWVPVSYGSPTIRVPGLAVVPS
jgi:TldD protein